MRVVLASTSPRRRELLALLGIPFGVQSPDFIETIVPSLDATEQATTFARGKARSVAVREANALVIGSDTLISLGGSVLGKPADLDEAAAMLRRLAGREHRIHTAVALASSDTHVDEAAVETVVVAMKDFGPADLARYLDTGESLGKAGAYSIQGAGGELIQQIEGDYTAAVGLPLRLVAQMLQRAGLRVPVDVEDLYRRTPYCNWARFQGSLQRGGGFP